MIFWATREIKTYLDKLWYYRINDNTPQTCCDYCRWA